MKVSHLKSARLKARWTQHDAAVLLGVSQPYYSQMEGGFRPVPAPIALRAVRRLGLSPVVLPLPPLSPRLESGKPKEMASALGRLGYPGFLHLRSQGKLANPALLVANALAQNDLDVRIIEALPWVLATFGGDLDWDWLSHQCRLVNAQNRLGFLVTLAREFRPDDPSPLDEVLRDLDRSKLAAEGTLCRESMPAAERTWVRRHRSPEAENWGLLTTLTRQQLTYAA